MYLLNARTLMQLAESMRGRRQDQGAHALRRAAVGRRDEPGQLPGAQPRGAEEGARHQGREHDAGPAAPAGNDLRKGHVSQTDETRVRGRPQRRHHRRARWCSRTSCSSSSNTSRSRAKVHAAADAVRAAVHQQVLHPRPAARELADPLHGRAGPSRVRGELAQPRRIAGRTRRGTTTSSTAPIKAIEVVQRDQRRRSRSTRSASASAARILATALAVLAARGEQPARVAHAADHAARLQATPACSTSSSTSPRCRCAR